MTEKVVPTESDEGQTDAVKRVSAPSNSKWKKKANAFMESSKVQMFLGVLLIMSLFMPDAFVLGDVPDSGDLALDIILILIFIAFALESVVLSIVNPEYFASFFFWCDVIGTISILLDIKMLTKVSLGDTTGQTSLLRAARAAKVGARYGRLMRVLKFIKFMDYVPCLKKNDESGGEPDLSAARKVSNRLSTVLSHRVAGLVLLLVVVVPFLSYDMYYGASMQNESFDAWAKAMAVTFKFADDNDNIDSDTKEELCESLANSFDYDHRSDHKSLIFLKLKVDDEKLYDKDYNSDPNHSDNIVRFERTAGNVNVIGKLDKTDVARLVAMFNMLLIILVIVVLVTFAASFQNAIDVMVVVPLEKMMQTLRDSAGMILKSVSAFKNDDDDEVDDALDEGELETALLEKMVEKLARVAKHMMPDTTEIVAAGEHVDQATATWLNSNYSKMSSTTIKVPTRGVIIDSKMQMLKSGVDVALVNSWDFDVLQYNHQQLFEVNQYIFSVMGFFNDFEIPVPVFEAFILEMSRQYKDKNSYHNFFHACDVAHTVFRLIMESELHKILSKLEIFSTVVAAIGHDVGHPGVNNNFLVKSRDKLAMIHNDRSPLENMHCSLLYEIMGDSNKNIFCGLTEGQWREARKSITTSILGTDMMHHFDQINRVQIFLEVNGQEIKDFLSGSSPDVPCMQEQDQRLFIMELFLHCADISNPYKPFVICEAWANIVVEEFHSQGDREKAEGLEVSPMMDRESTNLYNMQMGFIEFVVAPLVNGFINCFPPLHKAGDYMLGNMQSWAELRKQEIDKDSKIDDKEGEKKKLSDRIEKFKDKMSFLKTLEDFEHARKRAS